MPDSPVARALLVLDLLHRRPGSTAADLAAHLGVSDRAVRRAVATLRAADIAIESTPGRFGGYRLGSGLRLPPLVFTGDEALSLVMGVLDGHHGADDPLTTALGKIVRALPRDVGRQAGLLREHATAAPDRRAARPAPAITAALVDAIARRRQVRLDYAPRDGAPRSRTVDPWSVVVRHGLWYLLCRDPVRDVIRTYRVDRIRAVERGERSAGPPADLDPVAAVEEHLGRDREFAVRVRFAAPLAAVAPWVRPPMGQLTALDSTTCVLVGSTSNLDACAGELLAPIPVPMTVEGGPELRAAVSAVALRLEQALRAREC